MHNRCSVETVDLTWHLGDVVRKLRGVQSQEAFGRRTGTSRRTISRLELTGTGYNADTLARIALAVGCSVAELHAAVPPPLTEESRAFLSAFAALSPARRVALWETLEQMRQLGPTDEQAIG